MSCIPDCLVCGGAGYIHRDLPITDPNFGKLTRCPNAPVCVDGRNGISLEDAQGMDWGMVQDFNNATAAAAAVRSLLARGSGWLYLWGDPGLAKTLLLKIAVAQMIRENRPAAYTRMPSIMDNLRAAYDSANPSEEAGRRMDYWGGINLLAIDEVDRVKPTEWVRERQFVLLDRRYEDAVAGRSMTLFASNADPATSLDEYLFSRVNDGRFRIMRLVGSDFRPALEWAKE